MPNELNRVRIGRYKISPDESFTTITHGRIQASIFQPSSESMWADRIRARIGRTPGGLKPSIMFSAYEAGGGSAPDDWWGSTDFIYLLNTVMDSADSGVVASELFKTTYKQAEFGRYIPIEVGTRMAVAAYASDGADLNIGRVTAATGTEPNETAYYKTLGDVSVMPGTWGSGGTIASLGTMTIWIEGWENVPPGSPISLYPTGVIGTLAPNMGGRFRDLNGSYGASSDRGLDSGDHLNRCKIEVYRKSDNVMTWTSTYTCTQSEIDADISNRAYGTGGAFFPLVAGLTYKARIQHSDVFDEFGPWSDWFEFSVASGGSVDIASPLTPVGKTNNLQPGYQWKWSHATLSSDRARARLYKNGAVIETSLDYVATVAIGGTGTIPHGSFPVTGPLLPGEEYGYSVQARDSGGAWSLYSPVKLFKVDAAPGIPSNLSPAGNRIVSSAIRPRLMATVTDLDDAGGVLIVKARIKNSGGTVLQTRTMTLQAGSTNRFYYDTIAADFNVVGTYKFDVYAGDGYLWSGGTTVEASATKSAEATFQWQVIPTVAITSPVNGGTVATDTPVISWTVTLQDTVRVTLIDSVTAATIWDSGVVADTVARSMQVPPGYLHQGMQFNVLVDVVKTAVHGTDQVDNVVVDYPVPDFPGGLTATLIAIGSETQNTAVQLAWNAYAGSRFAGWLINRSDLDHPLAIITSQGEISWIDYHAPVGVEVSYSVAVLEELAGDTFSSSPDVVSAILQISGWVLVSVDDPVNLRVSFRSWKSREFSAQGVDSEYLTWGGDAPTAIYSPQMWQSGSISALLNEVDGIPDLTREALLNLARNGGVLSYRDRVMREWMRIPRSGGLKITTPPRGLAQMSLSLNGTDWSEGLAPVVITST